MNKLPALMFVFGLINAAAYAGNQSIDASAPYGSSEDRQYSK